ncbi:ABC transporter [Chloropicon primus]|uniref:ABC transporter n=1 Tax=Chloropicon primus TaxID=1764295 RepID=A0A5B8N2I2_9CHLO|nr:ABC transporter [Chloropicon primus]|eukprot:QDZ26080.1 ABC transporter [Chloropicon primus]
MDNILSPIRGRRGREEAGYSVLGEGEEEHVASVSQRTGRKSTGKQLWAILKKNLTLKLKSRRNVCFCGCTVGGIFGLLFELLLPSILILLLSIPKIFLPPIDFPLNEVQGSQVIESIDWVTGGCPNVSLPIECFNPLWEKRWDNGMVLYTPDGDVETSVMQMVAKDISCPKDVTNKDQLVYFGLFWKELIDEGISPPMTCAQSHDMCLNDSECWQPLIDRFFKGFGTPEAALHFAAYNNTAHTRAIVNFEDLVDKHKSIKYTLRMNHTMTPPTVMKDDVFSLNPQTKTSYFRKYFFFSNFQLSIDKALIGEVREDNNDKKPADIDLNIHQFPAPTYSLNPDAVIAGSFMDICLVVAFLMPMRSNVASVVCEKELRLREGMRLLGVTDFSYWLSWLITHGMEMVCSSLFMSLTAMLTFPESDWRCTFTMYFFLSLSLIPLAYVVSCFFQRTATAGPSVVLLFVILMIPGMLAPVLQPYGGYFFDLASFLSPSCVALSGTVLRRLEYSGIGLTWETFSKPVILDGSLSAYSLVLKLARNALIYLTAFVYLDKVLPDEAGRRQPFYFPFTKSFWTERGQRLKIARSNANLNKTLSPDLKIVNLTKEFTSIGGTKVRAVNDLCVEAFNSEVFGLLGHNGAGKTTTMSIITGMLYPTSGNVYVDNRSVLNEMDIIRKSLGLCPQFDILWPTLTVKDHLTFYAEIKGVPRHQIRTCVFGMAQEVGLSAKLNCPSCELSGGQMRKLSVGIAFMGNPKLVVLDEPTSGMDPRSRRDTWDIIRKNRRNKVIILSTHFMEEADILCDRIGIMHRGSLATCGSSLELKEEFGAGYVLTMILKDTGADTTSSLTKTVMDAVNKIIPDAKSGSGAGSELSVRIDKKHTDIFPELTEECEKLQQDGVIRSYGLSFTTLEDVFLKVVATCEKKSEEESMDEPGDMAAKSSLSGFLGSVFTGQPEDVEIGSTRGGIAFSNRGIPKHSGRKLLLEQLKAMIWKKFLCTTRERLIFVVQILVPILLIIAALTSAEFGGTFPNFPALPLNRENIFKGHQVIFGASKDMRYSSGSALDYFKSSYGSTKVLDVGAYGDKGLDDFALKTWFDGSYRFDMLLLDSYDSNSANGTVSANFTSLHALPTAVNAFTSGLAKSWIGRKIEVVNHPLPVLASEEIVEAYQFVFKFIFVCCMTMAAASLSASFAMFLVQERVNKSKQVQMVSGVHKGVFWLSHFLWDLVVYTIPATGMIICFQIYHESEFTGKNTFAVLVLFIAYGCASLPCVYVLHWFFEEPFKAFLRLWTVCFLSGYIFFLVDWIFGFIAPMDRTCRYIHNIESWVFPIISPQFNMANGMYQLQLNENDPLDPFAVSKSPFNLEVAGWSIIFMFIQMFMYAILVLAIEYNVWEKVKGFGFQYWNDCVDFERMNNSEDLVIAKDLYKKYAPFLPASVDSLSFQLGKNECFGLLGVNGAGKTTTFKMLTGEIMPTSGHALIAGHDIVTNARKARLFMGYCPQFEAVIGNMTGREMLMMYAMVRGIPAHCRREEVERIIYKLDLPRYADKLSGTYSGGNKRKLAVAAAVVGDPKVILLDEPSTGMDPVAKRFLWNVISDMYNNEEKSVVLTSHSMAECEALCSRIGIMVAGKFRCEGQIQEIKNNFGGGYHVEFRFTDKEQLVKLTSFMSATYPQAKEVESTDLYCLYQIAQEEAHLPTLFKTIKQAKAQAGFEAFSVSQTSLEQVFIKFANEGSSGTGV